MFTHFTRPQKHTDFKVKVNHINCNKIAFLCVCVVSMLITWSSCGDWPVPAAICVRRRTTEKKRETTLSKVRKNPMSEHTS